MKATINSKVRWGVIIFLICIVASSLGTGYNPIYAIGLPLLGYYWLGPCAADWGLEKGRNPNWGFMYGSIFNVWVVFYYFWLVISSYILNRFFKAGE